LRLRHLLRIGEAVRAPRGCPCSPLAIFRVAEQPASAGAGWPDCDGARNPRQRDPGSGQTPSPHRRPEVPEQRGEILGGESRAGPSPRADGACHRAALRCLPRAGSISASHLTRGTAGLPASARRHRPFTLSSRRGGAGGRCPRLPFEGNVRCHQARRGMGGARPAGTRSMTTDGERFPRVLYVGTLPPHRGGSALTTCEVLNGLARLGHWIAAIAPITEYALRDGDPLAGGSGGLEVRRFVLPHFNTSPDTPQPDEYRRLEGQQIER